MSDVALVADAEPVNVNRLIVEAWEALSKDGKVRGYVQDVGAGVLARTERIAEQVLAWELAGQVVP